jgi:DNA-binding NarL/FixJ family response regulator
MEESMGRRDAIGLTEQPAPTSFADAESAIAIVDQSRLRRECLRLALLQHSPQWRVSETSSMDEIVRLAESGERFDLVLVGAATSEHVDLAALEELHEALADTPIVVVAESDNPYKARQILSAGVRGFLPASLSLKVLMGALDLVLAGGVYVPSSLIDASASPQRPGALSAANAVAEPWSELTRRQRDVLALISQGKSNKLIADALTMSESTVKAHVKQIIKRLHVANRTQAALVATGRGIFGASAPTASPSSLAPQSLSPQSLPPITATRMGASLGNGVALAAKG